MLILMDVLIHTEQKEIHKPNNLAGNKLVQQGNAAINIPNEVISKVEEQGNSWTLNLRG